MSVSNESLLVAGVRLSDVFEVVDEPKQVTRYDPDTGRPHETTVAARKFLLFGKEVPEPDGLDEDAFLGSTGLKLFCAGGSARECRAAKWRRYDLSLYFLGLAAAVACPNSWRDDVRQVERIDPEAPAVACRTVADKLRHLGVAPVALWLIAYQSC